MVMVVIFSGLTLGGVLSANLGAGLDAGTAVANTIANNYAFNFRLVLNADGCVNPIWSRLYAEYSST